MDRSHEPDENLTTEVEARLEEALALHRGGDVAGAERRYREIVADAPGSAAAWNYLGVTLRARGAVSEAVDAGREAVALDPGSAEAWNNLANTLRQAGEAEAANGAYGRALEINPKYAEAWANRAMLAENRGEREAAVSSYARAAELLGTNADLQNDLGNRLFSFSAFAEAAACYERACVHDTGLLPAWNNLGNTLRFLGRFDDAITAYEHALGIEPGHPEAANGLAQTLLLTGDFQRGWSAYEARFSNPQSPARPDFGVPEWDGGNLEGRTILLWAEQGLGDTLQFLRFCPTVAAKGGRVLVRCQERVAALAGTVEGVSGVITEGRSPPPVDCQAPLMSLPRILGLGAAFMGECVPYISVPGDRSAPPLDTSQSLRVGLCWAGNPDHAEDRRRSVGLETLRPLADIAGVSFHGLQPGAGTSAFPGLADLAARDRDLADAAAAVSALDLVITVDTAIAHLAGALGRPCWLMLPEPPDWRWQLGRGDSPWYPSLRLFRQTRPGDWPGVIAAVQNALEKHRDGRP